MGSEVSTLDERLNITGRTRTKPSTFERGHATAWYSADMTKSDIMKILNSNLFQAAFNVAGATFQFFGAMLKIQNDGIALDVATQGGNTKFRFDITRNTFRILDQTALPTGTSTVGEMTMVNGLLMFCTVSGFPGTWVSVGSQSA